MVRCAKPYSCNHKRLKWKFYSRFKKAHFEIVLKSKRKYSKKWKG